MNARKLVIYGGVIFLSLTTIFAVIANSSLYRAQVALEEPCIAETDVNGDGLINNDDCTGGGGGNVEPCPEPIPVEEGTAITQTVPKECEEDPVCEPDPPFDTAFEGHTIGAFGSGGSGANQITQPLSTLLGVDAALAQSGGSQLSESRKFEEKAKQLILQSWDEVKFRYDRTLLILRNPSDWFNNQSNLNRFASTFSSEITEVMTDPTLPYYERWRAAQQAAPDAFKRAMEQFAYGKKDKHAEGHVKVPDNDNPWKLDVEPNWSEFVTSGLRNLELHADVYNWVGSNSGSYTKCDADFGFASGNSSNRFKGLKLNIEHGSNTTLFRASVGWNHGLTFGAFYQKSF